jgi:hypothetical protein
MATQEEITTALKNANEMCRSAFQIAQREGKDTNWEAFKNRLHESLIIQHNVLYNRSIPVDSISSDKTELVHVTARVFYSVKQTKFPSVFDKLIKRIKKITKSNSM